LKTKEKPRTAPDCGTCNGLCCRHIAMHLDTPSKKGDYDNLRWFLTHKNVMVGIDHEKNWMIEMTTSCRHLRKNRCTIYAKRPRICKIFPGTEDTCEHEDPASPYKVLFHDETELEAYLDKINIAWKWK
jgi:Fe-S-cluster containining protein